LNWITYFTVSTLKVFGVILLVYRMVVVLAVSKTEKVVDVVIDVS